MLTIPQPAHGIPQQQFANIPPHQSHGGYAQPYGAPVPGFQPVHSAFSPPAHMTGFSSPQGPPYPQAFSPPQSYPAPMMSGFGGPGQFPPGPAHGTFPGGPPPQYGAASPPVPYGQQGQFQPPRMTTPPQAASSFTGGQARNGHMSSSGLPQRPVSGAPPVNPAILQQMHKGQYNAQQHAYPQPTNGSANSSAAATPAPQAQTPVVEPTPAPQTQTKSKSEQASKKTKKEEKMRMVYSDNETSPEEKMSKLTRYHFQRDAGTVPETVFAQGAEAVTAG